MARKEHVSRIFQGVAAWNRWRTDNPDIVPNLGGAGLRGLDLTGANLDGADMQGADLRGTILSRASLIRADLAGANLFKAVVDAADVDGANLTGADFLECSQLTATRNWQSTTRDETLACGAPIPEPRARD
jgi:uncharacterized protein YjbI with pentapeptide repeats